MKSNNYAETNQSFINETLIVMQHYDETIN